MYLRHLVRSSATVIPGVSSIIRGHREISLEASITLSHPLSDRSPVRRFWLSTCDSMESRRFTSCSRDISREKIATVRPFTAMLRAMFRMNAVLPMEGLAATSTRSEGCMPDV